MECFYGYLVGVLSTIVTVLLGWQIFTVIGLESRLRRIRTDLTEQYKKDMQIAKYDASGMALAQMGLALYKLNDFGGAFLALTNALRQLSLGSTDKYNSEAKDNTIRLLSNIVGTDGLTFKICASDKAHYLAAANEIEDLRIREDMLNFILKAEME